MSADESVPLRPGAWRVPVQKRSRAAVKSIVDATRALLNEDPFEELTMLGVARRAGVSIGSIYRYFADKDDLIRAVQDRALEELEIQLVGRLSKAAEPTTEAVVTALVMGFDEVAGERALEFSALITVWDPALAIRARSAYQAVLAAFHAALAQDRGRIVHPDLRQAARVALEIVNALFLWYARSQLSTMKLEDSGPDRAMVSYEARRAATAYLLHADA
jgi:AcrR family transcriptional regulator